jgi:V8-like Glu-specific endopeptidase
MAVSPHVLADALDALDAGDRTIARLADRLPADAEVAEHSLEIIVGSNNDLVGLPEAVARILSASRAVGQLTTKVGAGTGFLIARGLLMTNNHMFVGEAKRTATAADAEQGLVTFNFEQDANGKFAETTQYRTAPGTFFAASLDLDCAVVSVDGDPGSTWGTLALPGPDVTLAVGDDVFIVQHPNGGPKQIVMSGNEVAYVDERVVQYTTDTQRGSSGSPVFDRNWHLAALHHAGGDHLIEPGSGTRYARNEGIRLSAILAGLAFPRGG